MRISSSTKPLKGRRASSRARSASPHGRGENLTYRIVEDLGIAVVTGRYTENNPFPVEADLCKQYGVSRSILREAVKMLDRGIVLESALI